MLGFYLFFEKPHRFGLSADGAVQGTKTINLHAMSECPTYHLCAIHAELFREATRLEEWQQVAM